LDSNRYDLKGSGGLVLAVTSDSGLLVALRDTFENPSLQVLVSESAADVPTRVKARQPQLVFIDADKIDVVTGDGSSLLDALKNGPYTAPVPVIVIAPVQTSEERQLDLFRRGVGDVLLRADNLDLLRERLLVLQKRLVTTEAAPETLEAEGLLLDLRARKVTVNGAPVALTRKEFDLLNMLLRKRGIVAYTTHLYHTVWGYGESTPVDSHTVKVHISSLRSKLGPTLGRKIVNLPGLGYRFDD
jgi:DNA-binding response OmpR family regulator